MFFGATSANAAVLNIDASGNPSQIYGNLIATASSVPAAGPLPFAQDTTLGVPVVPGVLSAERFRALRSLWPGLAPALARWPGTVLADLGRLHQGAPTVPVAQASTAVLLVTRADLEGLFHVRDRVAELAGMVGPGEGDPWHQDFFRQVAQRNGEFKHFDSGHGGLIAGPRRIAEIDVPQANCRREP